MNKEEKIQNLYNMLREFCYEKNGLDTTIEFLEYMLEQFKELNKEI